jgi:signal transduction histidine kinase/ligand-binding sensor domain-containing protein
MRIISCILLYLFSAYSLKAQGNVLKYSYRHFGTENGLTQNSAQYAVFDKNGYLWIGIRTDNVFVYDGYRFTPCWFYEHGKKQAFKSASLFCNSAGDIFIAHENGIHVRKQNTGAFVQVSKSVISRENEEIRFIGEGNNAEIYFYSYLGGMVYVLKKSAGGEYNIETSAVKGNVNIVFENSVDGIAKKSFFWFIKSNESDFYLFDIDQKKIKKKISMPQNLVIIARFAVDSSLYGLDNNYVLYKANTDGWHTVAMLDKFFSHDEQWQSTTFTNKNTGEIFIGPNKYLYKFNHNFTSIPSIITNTAGKPVLSKGGITKILQQDADHLWIFTTSEGIYQLDIKPKKFEHFKTDEGSLNFVRSIYKDESTGYVFSGLFYGGLVVYDAVGKIVKTILQPKINKENMGNFCVNGISKLANNIYLVWYNAGRAYLLNSTDWTLKSIINTGHLWKANYKDIVTDYAGFLNMGSNRFASGYKNRIYFFDASAQGIQIQDSIVCSLYRPEAFCYSTPFFYYGGIGSFYRYHTITKKIDSFALPLTTKVKWISRDKYNRLWVSTETGIAIVQNDKPDSYQVVKTLTTDDGLPNHYIYVAEPDNKAKMWCSSNKGIFSIDINNYSVTGYSTVDGLQSEEFNTGAFYRDSVDNFYYGGINGLNFFNPALMKESGEANRIHISFIGSGDSVLYQYPNNLLPASVDLSYKNPALLLRFSALNYNTQGFNQYEYKLHATDSTWTDNGSNNELQVLLSPGEYNIEVRLKNIPLPAAKLKVYVHPPFYQTIWFAVLAIAAIAAMVALFVNRRIKNKYRKKIALLEMQQKIQGERERISRDLHDDIGAKANMLAYNVSLLGKTVSEEELKQVKNRMKGTSDDMMQSLRETVWTLKQENITTEDVWTRFKNFIVKLQQTYSLIQFTIEEDELSDKKINYNEALNLIRILQEAVNNAIKHSGCKTICCSRLKAEQAVIFTVKDDGQGFDTSKAAELLNEGNGLQNMKQRAQESGFKFSIFTKQNNGTTVTVKV